MLADCIDSIARLQVPPNVVLSLILVDNDVAQTAKPLYEEKRHDFPFSFYYFNQSRRSLSRARNLGIEQMLADGGDAVLFVDDDMRLPPDYLTPLVADMQRFNADAVRGKMCIVEKSGQRHKIRRASMLARRDILAGNGVLVKAHIFREWGLRFDECFTSGFEDGDFFYRAHLRRARLFSSEHTYFIEYRPPERIPRVNRQQELQGLMAVRCSHVAMRKYRGGWLRALWYVCCHEGALLLQVTARIVILPLAVNKNFMKVQNYSYRLAGLVRGLWSFQIPLET